MSTHNVCFVAFLLRNKKNISAFWIENASYLEQWDLFVHLSLLTMTNPNQLCDVLLFVCSKMADETNLSSKLPFAGRTREV